MNLKPFKDFLTATLTTDQVFMFHMPETVTDGILILHNLAGAKLDPSLPGYKRAKFQTIVRSNNFENGYAKSKQIMDVFKVAARKTQSNIYFHFIEPLHDPVAFPVSKGNFIEFSVNFETAYTET